MEGLADKELPRNMKYEWTELNFYVVRWFSDRGQPKPARSAMRITM